MQSETPRPARRRRSPLDWPTAILITIVVSAAAYVYWRDGAARFLEVVWADSRLFVGMMPNVLAGCLIAAAFLGMGADAAAVVTLITSWTTLGMSRALVWEMPFLGFDFVLWRWIGALPLAVMAGLIVRAIERHWRARAKP